jgi:hypothetical protein
LITDHVRPLGLLKRSGKSAMMARRRSSSMAPHAAISPSVRPQPTQSPLLPSTMHTLMQGVEMGGAVFIAVEDGRIGDAGKPQAPEPTLKYRKTIKTH